MRKWWMMVALAIATMAAFPTAAQEETGNNNLRLRVGVFFPTKSETRDAADKAWFTAGVEYALQPLVSPGIEADFTLSADFMGNQDMQNIPVQLNLTGAVSRFTWSVGAGIGFAKNIAGEAKTGLTYSVGIAAELGTTRVPLELGVMWRGMTNVNNQLDGVAVHLQVRF
ncbi:MAG: transporter [Armatimonadota bacterium]|nr:transporter [bacterium]MDW8289723.1 transporter [Armatimonadota bacterium]